MPAQKQTQLLKNATTRSGYWIRAYRISEAVDPAAYRGGYTKFYETVRINALPSGVDSSWTKPERHRVSIWQELLQLPSTHVVDVRCQDPRVPRQIITAYLRLSCGKSHPDSVAKRLADFILDFLDVNADTPLVHPLVVDASILAAIAGVWDDVRAT